MNFIKYSNRRLLDGVTDLVVIHIEDFAAMDFALSLTPFENCFQALIAKSHEPECEKPSFTFLTVTDVEFGLYILMAK